MTWRARKALRALCDVHGLARRDRKLVKTLASAYGFDGRGGPETSPLVLFFRKSFWEKFERDAADGRDRIDPREIHTLARTLFAIPAGRAGRARPEVAAETPAHLEESVLPEREQDLLPADWSAPSATATRRARVQSGDLLGSHETMKRQLPFPGFLGS